MKGERTLIRQRCLADLHSEDARSAGGGKGQIAPRTGGGMADLVDKWLEQTFRA